jgi:hypothetical protein
MNTLSWTRFGKGLASIEEFAGPPRESTGNTVGNYLAICG